MSIRSAASWCQPRQRSVVPRGARTRRGPAAVVVSLKRTSIRWIGARRDPANVSETGEAVGLPRRCPALPVPQFAGLTSVPCTVHWTNRNVAVKLNTPLVNPVAGFAGPFANWNCWVMLP